MYHEGHGVTKDFQKAKDCFEQADEQNNALAVAYFVRADAQLWLGYMYFYGDGVKAQDYLKAKYYFKLGTELGVADAQFHLGLMYYYGYGVKQDYLKAKYYYKQAAAQGHKKAQKELKFLE